jgi:predicted TIM-barrel fold metal-dependent hydrolase
VDLSRVMASPNLLLEMSHYNGVDSAVVLTEMSPITTGVISNEALAQSCFGQEALIPIANVNPFLVGNPARELGLQVREMGFRGLKLCPTYQGCYSNDSILYPFYAKAQ